MGRRQASDALRYLQLSGLSLSIAVAVCLTMQPSPVFTHYGLSYYGNFRATLLPFCIGLVMSGYFLWRAASAFGKGIAGPIGRIKIGLQTISVSMFGLLATPSLSMAMVVKSAHVCFGTVIFAGATLLTVRYMIGAGAKLADRLLMGCLLAALVVICLSFEMLGVLKLMLPGQLMGGCAFSFLLLRSVGRWAEVRQD